MVTAPSVATQPVIAVVGPTATGKSELAVELALRLADDNSRSGPVEIVNADSMQLYKGMDIGTAKSTLVQRRGVVHHLLDVWPITKSAAVAEYQQLARAAIARIHARQGLPILVGGSGLYVRATLDPLDFPGESPIVRAALDEDLVRHGASVLHRRLQALDPAAAESILPTNGRRIVRALEVIELTGAPFAARMPAFESIYTCVQIGLDRDDVDRRVDTRVDRMIEAGLVDEVAVLCADGLRSSPTAGKALGYAQVLAAIDDHGHVHGDLTEAIAITKRATRRFVRRQRSWFRRDPRVGWLDAGRRGVVDDAMSLVRPTLVG